MEFFSETKFKFIEKRKGAFLFSGILILLSAFFFFKKGINWGIDFTGGSLVQLNSSKYISNQEIRKLLEEENLGGSSIQRFSGSNVMVIRVKKGQELG